MTKKGDDQRKVEIVTGEQAFFALIAHDMIELSKRYRKDVDELHKIFYTISCDREKLIKWLEGKKVDKWDLL